MAKYKKRIVCLANSRKPDGRCVAGIELDGDEFGDWVRPVSSRSSQSVSLAELQYEDGSEPQLGDVVQIQFIAPAPDGHQRENEVLDSDRQWEKVAEVPYKQLKGLTQDVKGPLWVNNHHSYNGVNDEVPASKLAGLSDSLKLIAVPKLTIHVQTEYRGKKKVRGEFKAAGETYKLTITDVAIEDEYLAKELGEYDVGAALLCVSLTKAWKEKGIAYKLIAAVIQP